MLVYVYVKKGSGMQGQGIDGTSSPPYCVSHTPFERLEAFSMYVDKNIRMIQEVNNSERGRAKGSVSTSI